MKVEMLARDELWEIAEVQHGLVTAQQATEADVTMQALQMLVHRGTCILRSLRAGVPLVGEPAFR